MPIITIVVGRPNKQIRPLNYRNPPNPTHLLALYYYERTRDRLKLKPVWLEAANGDKKIPLYPESLLLRVSEL